MKLFVLRLFCTSVVCVVIWIGNHPFGFAQCTGNSGNPHSLGLKKYKINLSSFQEARDNNEDVALTDQQVINAIILAADAWNEQGNAGHFQYVGTTTNVTPNCNNDFSVVYFDYETPSSATADLIGVCPDINGKNRFFRLRFYLLNENGDYRNWDNASVVDPLIDKWDLKRTATHEFGHALSISDLPNGNVAVMISGAKKNAIEKWWLYERDFICLDQITGKRSVGIYAKHQDANGGFGNAILYDASGIKGTVGLTYDGTIPLWNYVYHNRTNVQWDALTYSSGTVGINLLTGTGFDAGLWRENNTIDRVFYSNYLDTPSNTNWDSVHQLKQSYSTTKFVVNHSFVDMNYCSSMNGFGTCLSNAEQPLHTAYRTSIAYVADINKTVMAWANHDRSEDGTTSASNEIWISVGSKDTNTLLMPYKTGIRTMIAPSIACYENFYTDYNCLLAYVPIQNYDGLVTLRLFKVISDQNNYGNYTIQFYNGSSTLPTSTNRTSSPIAIWYNGSTNQFYLAFRTMDVSQNMALFSTTYGFSFTRLTDNLDYSITGPSSANMWRGNNNRLLYIK